MASYVMLRIAEGTRDKYPDAATVIERDRYVDDLIHSCSSQQEAASRMNQLDQALSTGSFHIKKWYRSATERDESAEKQSPDKLSDVVPLNKEGQTKALGVVWDVQKDIIRYEVNQMEPCVLTKRIVLSRISGIYDPLGLASGVTIRARIALQDIWRMKTFEWDDELPQDVQIRWEKLFKELRELQTVEFPRGLKPTGVVGDPGLHVFCDASAEAYGAVAYIMWPTEKNPEIRIIAGKARVAPLRQTTIPHLELMGALIASRLAKTLMEEFKLKPVRVTLWCDSQIVLHWIQSETATLKAYVGIRVSEIQSTWSPDNWRFVPTALNPADDLTRGLSVIDIEKRWKHGLDFLREPEENWPVNEVVLPENDREQKKPKAIAVIDVAEPVIKASDYSSWQRLTRITAYVQRFCHNTRICAKAQQSSKTRLLGALQPEEIERAEWYWISFAQRSLDNWQKNCQNLSPFLEDGMIRVGGRLRKSSLPYEQVHPILLPASHEISKLILRETHFQMGYVGPEKTLSENRRRFWIVKGRNMSKSIVRECVVCRKLQQAPHVTLMSDLPPERMTPFSPPFSVTGFDLYGPFNLKFGRNKSQKAWGAIFTCATVRAIHLEIVDGLSTPAFLHALRRFAAHHGWPNTIISDNGTSFVGAEKELRKLVQEGKRQILRRSIV